MPWPHGMARSWPAGLGPPIVPGTVGLLTAPPEAPLPGKSEVLFEVQTANREPNGGARDAAK
jgi:hypothetical protein